MKRVISSIEASLEKPAAWRSPPPPDLRAMAETSSFVRARAEAHAARGLPARGGSRISATMSAPSTARRVSIRPSEYASAAFSSVKSLRRDVRHDETAALVDLRPLHHAREQPQLRDSTGSYDHLEDTMDVGAGVDELGGEPERLRRRVRVWKRPVSVTSAT